MIVFVNENKNSEYNAFVYLLFIFKENSYLDFSIG